MPNQVAPPNTKTHSHHKLNLALQGGGSHGAFTWGVLDGLLEQEQLNIEAIVGASAGAMNAAAFAHGWLSDSKDRYSAARESLEKFWLHVAQKPGFASFTNPLFDSLTSNFSLENNPAFIGYDLISRLASPYQLNPLNLNPLRDVIEAEIDFERINHPSAIQQLQLFVCATNVRTGRVKIFSNNQTQIGNALSCDALMASACLPFVFQAVEIAGEHYWDGGYMGNPSLYPLFNTTRSADILLVQINPLIRDDVPNTASEIIDRINEISFNASLLHEIRAIEFVQRLIDEGHLKARDENDRPRHFGHFMQKVFRRHKTEQTSYKKIRMHLIEGGDALAALGATSKFNTSEAFLLKLRDLGRDAAKHWLRYHRKDIGVQSSVDIAKKFL